jgi:hypothetical protein
MKTGRAPRRIADLGLPAQGTFPQLAHAGDVPLGSYDATARTR